MKATSCLEIFSLLIFSAATLGMILKKMEWESPAIRKVMEATNT